MDATPAFECTSLKVFELLVGHDCCLLNLLVLTFLLFTQEVYSITFFHRVKMPLVLP